MRQNPAAVQAAAEQIREMYTFYLLTQPRVRLAISRQPAGTAATKLRWTGFRAEVQKILDGTYVEPRFFSLEFRRQMFEAHSPAICKICGGEIHAFDDCAVDHIHPWSRKGRTIPENGQLAHKTCNSRKSASLPEDGGG